MDGARVKRRTRGIVRVVAGRHRGRQILVPKGHIVRPTSNMVREAIFDVLQEVDGLRVLDLFAGTGALGLEALSRGARECVFVESDAGVAHTLRRNIAVLGEESRSIVVVGDYRQAASGLIDRREIFDLLFADPPYRMLAEVELSLAPLAPSLLPEAGVLVIEGPTSIPVSFGGTLLLQRDYGDTRVTMIRLERSDP